MSPDSGSPVSAKARSTARNLARKLASTSVGRRARVAMRDDSFAVSLDWWLDPLFSESLDQIESALQGAGPEGYALFRDLDDDLWSLLLTKEFESWPGIRSFLPDLPDPALQQMWNGTSGPTLAAQSVCFYRKLKEMQKLHGTGLLERCRTLDFGCGWGRLTRMLGRDVEPGLLYGCDPVDSILDVSRQCRVPANLARSEFLPEELPFEERFDLVFAFSVFTHISEAAHLASLEAIHSGLAPDGLLVVTVRPPSYISHNPMMQSAAKALGSDPLAALKEPNYLFMPHDTDGHPQYDEDADDPMSYGETVIPLAYIREKWASMFDLLDVSLMTGDMYQVAVTLRRK